MSEYKTFEELKEELGDEFEDYMYKANIELLTQLQQKENIIKSAIELLEKYTPYLEKKDKAIDLLYILRGDGK